MTVLEMVSVGLVLLRSLEHLLFNSLQLLLFRSSSVETISSRLLSCARHTLLRVTASSARHALLDMLSTHALHKGTICSQGPSPFEHYLFEQYLLTADDPVFTIQSLACSVHHTASPLRPKSYHFRRETESARERERERKRKRKRKRKRGGRERGSE